MSNYPTSIDDASSLLTPADSFSGKPLLTTLAANCLSTDTDLQLLAAVGTIGAPVAYGILSIDDEQIIYTGHSEVGSVYKVTGCTRGAFGTIAVGHTSPVVVRWRYVAAFDLALQAAVEAIQTTIGVSGAYNFLTGPAGSDKAVQFNDGGVLAGGGPTYDKTTHHLTVAGPIESTTTGFKFPDGTTQSTASSGGGGGTPSGAAGGDLSGSYPNPGVAKLGGTAVTVVTSVGTPGTDAHLATEKAVRSSIPTTLPPNGAAGGDLNGSYPNPTVASISGVPIPQASGNLSVGVAVASSNGSVGRSFGIDAAGNTHGFLVISSGATAGSGVGGGLEVKTKDTISGGDPRLGQFFFFRLSDITAGRVSAAWQLYTNVDGTMVPAISISPGGVDILAALSLGVGGQPVTAIATTVATPGVDTNLVTEKAVRTAINGAAGGDLVGSYPNPTLAASGVTAATYGDSTHVAQVVVDAKGRVTSASNVAIPAALPPNGSAGGDLVGTYPNPTLGVSGVTAATYGDSTHIAQVAVDAKGRVTSAASVAIPTSLPPNGSAGGDLTGTYPNPTLVASGVTASTYGSSDDVSVVTIDAKGRVTGAVSTASRPGPTIGTVGQIQVTNGSGRFGTQLDKVTSIGTPGVHTSIPTEKAVRDAIANQVTDGGAATAGHIPVYSSSKAIQDGLAVDTVISGSGDNISVATTKAIVDLINSFGFATTSYANGVASAAQSAAESYADGAAATAQNNAENYADSGLSNKADHGTYTTHTGLDSVTI